ncbi:Protein disulfide-isomerase 5-3 [Heracleum sosnowskyi]|uniref:Protein disulfide-isomerase 5-3 n=1 Tax=Heracleum sosnowskyi TaxID=360622 RepID=A0AAD8N1Z2_9APIA|nr:Protein disulfide-isomerase 5-3 [Heracleum sosnowskyi]
MVSSSKIKSVDFYRKIPRDLTEASLSGAGLSILAAFFMIFLFGMELNSYLTLTTTTSVIVDKSPDEDFLRIDFNISFPALSCEFASVDMNDVLGTNRLNVTKTVRKYSIDRNFKSTGPEFLAGPVSKVIKHDDFVEGAYAEGSVSLNAQNFDRISHLHPILVVNFFAPWCSWSNRLRPSWEKAATILRERYDPEMDGRILLGKVDCTEESELCRRNHIQGYPSIRIFRKGSDVRDEHGHHEHEAYYGDRDTDSLVTTMEELAASVSSQSQKLALEDKSGKISDKKPAPVTGGCRVEGFVRVKKVPGNLVISARSGAHSFDASQMNMSHVVTNLSFGKKITPKVMSDINRVLPYIGRSHNKLHNQAYITHRGDSNITIEHYLQIVKTEVMTRAYKIVEDYEYTAHSSLVNSPAIPAAKFHLELSPLQVLIEEKPKSFSHFLTNLCAIIGGVFTVAGILDSILHNTLRLIKKVELGKNF